MVKRFILVIIMMVSSLSLSSFTSANKTVLNNGDDEVRTSRASYYHDKFNGRRTANGEIFSNNKMTAAHKKLPFGTMVKVTNLRNGKSIIVRINDRGPYHSKREIDLSKAAFDEIGDLAKGTMPIEYEIVN